MTYNKGQDLECNHLWKLNYLHCYYEKSTGLSFVLHLFRLNMKRNLEVVGLHLGCIWDDDKYRQLCEIQCSQDHKSMIYANSSPTLSSHDLQQTLQSEAPRSLLETIWTRSETHTCCSPSEVLSWGSKTEIQKDIPPPTVSTPSTNNPVFSSHPLQLPFLHPHPLILSSLDPSSLFPSYSTSSRRVLHP